MKKHFLLLLMTTVTLFTAATFLIFSPRLQDAGVGDGLDDGARTSSTSPRISPPRASFMGRGQPQRHRPQGMPGMMRFRMLSADPALQSPEAGGILVVSKEGRIVSASPGAERLLPLWEGSVPDEAPREARDVKGDSYYVVVRPLQDGNFILAAVSRTYLLAPLTGVWKTWIVSAMTASAVVFFGMLLLWYWLAVPLRGIAERLGNVEWGKERSVRLYDGPLAELEALSSVIGRLAEESFEKEELKKRYVTDLVQAQETTRGTALRGSCTTARSNRPSRRSSASSLPNSPRPGDTDASSPGPPRHRRGGRTDGGGRDPELLRDAPPPSWVRLGLSSALEEIAGRLAQAYEGGGNRRGHRR